MAGIEGYGTLPVRQAMQWLAERTGFDSRLVRWFTARFFTDVSTYFDEPRRRQEVQDTLSRTIAENCPRVVIAHSFGSVVAYEALWRDGPDIELLITLGSPLGMPGVVFERLLPQPAEGRGLRPKHVLRWVNIADPGDLIALPRGLGRKFDGLAVDLEPVIGAFEFHRVARYLATLATREQVSEALRTARHA
jgi:pimeloyl-ACP methyl ester carboxylesterase